MTVNQFYTFVDDLVQTNLEMVDVVNGRSCKIPLESTVTLQTIQFEVSTVQTWNPWFPWGPYGLWGYNATTNLQGIWVGAP